jgi:phage tail-like protein
MPANGANIGLSSISSEGDLRVDPHRASHFVVEIEGVLAGGFAQVLGLEVEVETFEYREGGRNDFVHRFAGSVRHPPLVLSHGVSPIDGLWAWHQDVASGVITRRNGTIYLLDQSREPVVWWNFQGALPVKWTGPSLDALQAAVAFETVELSHCGLSRPARNESQPDLAGELSARLRDGLSALRRLGGFF